MKINDAKNTIVAMLKSKKPHPILLLGGPGIGKTAVATQAGKQCGLPLITLALPTCEAVDLRGMMHLIDGRTYWASPFPREGEGLLILDELPSAAPDVQVAAHHLLWAEAGSDMGLPKGWHVIATGNRAKDRTLYRAPSAPLRNRMIILHCETDVKQWCQWSETRDIHPLIPGFLSWRPDALALSEPPGDGAFPSPRSWETASDILKLSIGVNEERELLAGAVGEGETTELCAFIRSARELPTVRAVLDDPHKAKVPKSPAMLYALTSLLSDHTRRTEEGAMDYVSRLPAEFAMCYILSIRDHYDIKIDSGIRTWIDHHPGLFE